MKATAYALGAALVAVGLGGLLAHAADTRPLGWLAWFAGVAIAHDLVLVPAVLALSALVTRVPARYRTPVLAAAVIGGILALVSLPLVLGFGKSSANPSQLPLPYGRNLLIVLSVIATAAGAVIGCRAWSARARRAAGDTDRDERPS